MTFDELASPKTFLPGVKAKHAIISPACREGRGDAGAAEAAIGELHRELTELLGNWPADRGATFHLVLTVDKGGRGDPYAPIPLPSP